MQIELSAILGVAGSVAGVVVSMYIAILRHALAQKERETERRFADLEKALEAQTTLCVAGARLHVDRLAEAEKLAIRQGGQIDLAENNHATLMRDLDEIKRSNITKAEFEPRMTNLERTLNQILAEIRGRSAFPSHGSMAAVTAPSPKR